MVEAPTQAERLAESHPTKPTAKYAAFRKGMAETVSRTVAERAKRDRQRQHDTRYAKRHPAPIV